MNKHIFVVRRDVRNIEVGVARLIADVEHGRCRLVDAATAGTAGAVGVNCVLASEASFHQLVATELALILDLLAIIRGACTLVEKAVRSQIVVDRVGAVIPKHRNQVIC